MTLHISCPTCGKLDIILKENAKDWACPFCLYENNEIEEAEEIKNMFERFGDIDTLVYSYQHDKEFRDYVNGTVQKRLKIKKEIAKEIELTKQLLKIGSK